ncbi:MAG: hypothetical protein K6T86_08380 [Pirellulales bacterium]|nr:hypothetical protein [Pirellulales bacterium]
MPFEVPAAPVEAAAEAAVAARSDSEYPMRTAPAARSTPPTASPASSSSPPPRQAPPPETAVQPEPLAEQAAAASTATAAGSPQAQPSPAREQELIRVKCRVCGTLLYFGLHEVGRQARCPDCEVALTVPPPPPPAPPPPPPPDPGEYAVGEEPPRIRPNFEYLARPRDDLQEEAAPSVLPPPPTDEHPLPRLWYLVGVIDMPWRRWAVVRWGVLAFLLGVAEIGSYQVVQGLAAARSWGEAILPLVLLLPALVAALGALSCALAWFHVVFRETAAGEEEIEDFSGGDVLGWFTAALWMAYYALLAWAVAGLLVRGAMWGNELQVLRLVLTLLLFLALLPLVLLASLEAESPWIPWSLPVYIRLGQRPGDFLKVYLVELALVGLLFGLVWLAAQLSPVLSMALSAPLEAATVLIIARLLGRLAIRMRQRSKA